MHLVTIVQVYRQFMLSIEVALINFLIQSASFKFPLALFEFSSIGLKLSQQVIVILLLLLQLSFKATQHAV